MSVDVSRVKDDELDEAVTNALLPMCRVDGDGKVISVNGAWSSLPLPLCRVAVDHSLAKHFPSDLEGVIVPKKNLFRETTIHRVSLDNGEVVDVLIAPTPQTAIISVLPRKQESTKPIRTQRSIDANAILATLPDSLFVIDRSGRFVDYASGAATAVAASTDLFLGRLMDEILPADVCAVGRAAMKDIDEDGKTTGRLYRLTDARGSRWFELSGSRGWEPDLYVFLSRDVTNRITAEQKTKEKEEWFATLFELSSFGLVLSDIETREIIEVNSALLRMTGWSREELIGNSAEILSGSIDEDRRKKTLALLKKGERPSFVEMNLNRKDGTQFPCLLRFTKVVATNDRALLWTKVEDMTKEYLRVKRLEQAELEARRAWKLLHSAIDNLKDGFVFFDAAEQLVLANSSYREMYASVAPALQSGARFEELIRYAVSRGEYVDAAQRQEEFIAERLMAFRNPQGVRQHHLSDGRIIRIFETSLPDGGTVALHVDVTEWHKARDEAIAASESKSRFMSTLSHEIRNPLTAILGVADILSERRLSKQDHELANSIAAAGQTLLGILNDHLDLSKIEAGRMTLDLKNIDLSELLHPIELLYRRKVGAKGLQFSIKVDEGVQTQVIGDAHRLSQILYNLLSNALKFTDVGSVGLTVKSDAHWTVFVVEDTGPGMDQTTVERLFLPFEQGDASTASKYGGTGLGMSIVENLVQLMNGVIDVRSEIGQGTTISVRLPLPRNVTLLNGTKPSSPLLPELALHGVKVLIADDSDINRIILENYLTLLGGTVFSVENGKEAVAAFQKEDFDLICLDISMPELDGLAALKTIHADAQSLGYFPPPAVAITGFCQPEEIRGLRAAGFSAHLAKPFKKADLVKVCESLTEAKLLKSKLHGRADAS